MLKALLATFAVAFALAMLPACALLAPVSERVGEAIKRYCQEPAAARAALRDDVNANAAPHSVRVRCAGDPA